MMVMMVSDYDVMKMMVVLSGDDDDNNDVFR